MKIRYAITTPDELRSLCIKNNWFTAGTCTQYEKFFELNRIEASVSDMALVIWLCSDGANIEEIQRILTEVKVDYQVSCLCE